VQLYVFREKKSLPLLSRQGFRAHTRKRFVVLNPDFSSRIKYEREKRNLSIRQFSALVHMNDGTVLRAEMGQYDIKPKTAEKIAAALDISLDEYPNVYLEKETFSVLLGQAIEEQRKKRKLTSSALARLLGITIDTYQAWRSGIKTPTLKEVEKIAKTLKCHVNTLLQYSGSAKKHDNASPLSRRITNVMEARGINRSTLSVLSGMAPSTITRFLSGTYRGMAASRVARIANALGVSVDYLTGRTDQMDLAKNKTNVLPLFPSDAPVPQVESENLGHRMQQLEIGLEHVSSSLRELQISIAQFVGRQSSGVSSPPIAEDSAKSHHKNG
jgi:transcriptional regulator with XRE-family HTH domain